jgi:hypothetical protein
MSTFKVEKIIRKSRETVWEKLADFGNIDVFHPMVEKSDLIGEQQRGIGAERICNFYNNNGYVREEITDWVEGKSMSIEMKQGSMPVKNAIFHFTLADVRDGTKIKIAGDFQMRGGKLGQIIGYLVVKPMFAKILNDVLAGLETHIETGQCIGYKGHRAGA